MSDNGSSPILPEIRLKKNGVLQCEEVARHLPGRRWVVRARRGSQKVLAKLFLGPSARREAEQDLAAVKTLVQAGIPTPRPLEPEPLEAEEGWVVLYSYLEQARPFSQAWAQAGEAERVRLLEALFRLLARLHRSGAMQRDPHLDNFLVDERGGIRPVDGGAYSFRRGALPRRVAQRDLALLAAQFPATERRGLCRALECYAAGRELERPRDFIRQVLEQAGKWRHYRARKMAEKALRNCTRTLVRERSGKRIYQQRVLEVETLDGWLERELEGPRQAGQVLKGGNSQTVWRSRIGNRPVVVKRYNLKHSLHALRRLLGPSRGRRAWRNAHRLRAYGIPTPTPLAYVEERTGLARRGWLITEMAEGTPAHQLFREAGNERQMEALARVVAAFGENGLVHGDMKASNFIVGDEGVQVIDLDSLSRPRLSWLRRRGIRVDRERFLRNWKDPALRARFEQLLEEAESRYRGNRSRRA